MAKFIDAEGREWKVEFDGLLLDQVLQETGIDIADLSATGLFKLDQHAPTLVKVLSVICADERKERGNMTDRQFSKAIRGNILVSALEAVTGAAENFFPPNVWSAMQSHLNLQKEFTRNWVEIQPLLTKLSAPDMPQPLRDGIMAALAEMMGNIGSQPSATGPSATGQDATQPSDASSSPENAESTPKVYSFVNSG